MAFISLNPPPGELPLKIVYCGPAQSGKSCCLRHIHQQAPQGDRTELAAAPLSFRLWLSAARVNAWRPRLSLSCVTGSSMSAEARRPLLRGVDGIVFVADSREERLEANDEALYQLKDDLDELGISLAKIPLVLQYNKRDLPSAAPIEEIDAVLRVHEWERLESIASEGRGVIEALKRICGLSLREIMGRR